MGTGQWSHNEKKTPFAKMPNIAFLGGGGLIHTIFDSHYLFFFWGGGGGGVQPSNFIHTYIIIYFY